MTTRRLSKVLFSLMAFSAFTLTGCGAAAHLAAAAPTSDSAKGLSTFGFGHEGGEHPSLCVKADGSWEMVYAGTRLGDRHLYATASNDGSHWDLPQEITQADYSDQSPCLVKDASGTLHLFFASNRDGANWELYHSTFSGGVWQAPRQVPGYTGLQGLAVAFQKGRFLLLAQVLGDGLFLSSGADGDNFGDRSLVTDAGFEPSLAFLPDGRALLAYQRSGEIFSSLRGTDGSLSAESAIAKSADRLREPALFWNGTRGELLYSDDTADGYRLKSRLFDSTGRFFDGGKLPSLSGEIHAPSLAAGPGGATALAVGMINDSGQQGIGLIVSPNL